TARRARRAQVAPSSLLRRKVDLDVGLRRHEAPCAADRDRPVDRRGTLHHRRRVPGAARDPGFARQLSPDGGAGLSERSAMHKLRSWLCTIPFLVGFGLTMVLFDPFFRIAALFGKRANAYVCGALQTWLVCLLRLCGTRIDIERSPRVLPHT